MVARENPWHLALNDSPDIRDAIIQPPRESCVQVQQHDTFLHQMET